MEAETLHSASADIFVRSSINSRIKKERNKMSINEKPTMKILSLQELILENTPQIMKALEQTLSPVFDINQPEKYSHIFNRYVNLARYLLPMQSEKSAAIETFFETNKSCVAVLDTGYGKTQVSTSVLSNPNIKTALVVAPPHLTKKWGREIKTVLGKQFPIEIVYVETYMDLLPLTKFKYRVKKWEKELEVTVKKLKTLTNENEIKRLTSFIKSRQKLLKQYNQYLPKTNKRRVYIVAKTKNSLSYTTEVKFDTSFSIDKQEVEIRDDRGRVQKVVQKKIMHDYRCVNCSSKLTASTFAKMKGTSLEEKDTRKASKITKCKSCDTPTTQPLRHTISPAEFLKRYGIKESIDLTIIDELHEEKAKDSLRGLALGHLVPKSKNILGLTGTLLGGYASHAFYTFYRLFPRIFKNELKYEWSDVNEFIKEFGGSEEITQVIDYDPITFNITEYGRNFGLKERADMSPRLLDAILPMCIFGKLEEIKFLDKNASLPPYTEISHLVEYEDILKEKYTKYLQKLTTLASFNNKEFNDKKGWAKLKVDSVLIPDIPFQEQYVELKSPDGGVETVVYEPSITRNELPLTNKEKKLLEIIKQSKANNRKVLVYHDFINSGLRENLIEVLENNGLKVEQLTTAISPNKREEYIKTLDCDVLITNPELVKTGLDLLEYPTIIFYQQVYSSYNIFTMRQAAKRAWRIGQLKECEVHSIAYAGTHQATVLQLIGSKMNVSQTTEGRLSTGNDIASEAEDENMQIQMARAILSNKEIDNKSSSSSSTIDLNARDWTVLEEYYVNLLDEVKTNPDKFKPYTVKEDLSQYAYSINDEILLMDIDNIEQELLKNIKKEEIQVIPVVTVTPKKVAKKTTANKEQNKEVELISSNIRIFISNSKKMSKTETGKTQEITPEEYQTMLKKGEPIQLTLF